MRLKFYPNGTAMPKWPNRGRGDYPYMGRQWDADTRQNKATEDPCEVASGTPEARRAIQYAKDGALLCADEGTAAACGLVYVECEQDSDGNWCAAKDGE